MTLQADGKIVVTADGVRDAFAVRRFVTDGSPDETFGVGGTATAPNAAGTMMSNSAQAAAATVQPDGKIVGAGWASIRDCSPYTYTTCTEPKGSVGMFALARFEIKVANTGTTDAHDVTVTFVIPPGVDAPNVGMTPADHCAFIRQDPRPMSMATVACSLGTLARRTSTAVTITARPLYATSSPFKNTTFTTTSDREMSPTSATHAKASVKVVCPKTGPCPRP